jgi:hypothetical protein
MPKPGTGRRSQDRPVPAHPHPAGPATALAVPPKLVALSQAYRELSCLTIELPRVFRERP